MSDDPLLHPDAPTGGRPAWMRWGGLAAGVLLLGASIATAITKADWSHALEAQPAQAALLMGLVFLSLICNALMFQIALHPFAGGDRIGTARWQALMYASAVLNYLPKAGLLGRVAYLKARHGVAVRDHMFSLVFIAVGTAATYAVVIPLSFWRGDFDAVWWALTCCGLLLIMLIAIPMIRLIAGPRLRPTKNGALMSGVLIWLALRLLDSFCFAGRLYVSSEIFGKPIDLSTALVAGLLCNFTVMFAPLPGGLGLREWVGALLLTGGMGLEDGIGLLLVDRGAELAVFIATGVPSVLWLHRDPKNKEGSSPEVQVSTPSINQ